MLDNKLKFYKVLNADGTYSYDSDSLGSLSPGEIAVSKYEYLTNIHAKDTSRTINLGEIIGPILDIVWSITTQVAQKLIRKNVIFEDIWLSNLYAAFQYDIGKSKTMKDGDFAAFEQIFDEIGFASMENYLDIVDLFGAESKFDSSDFVKLLITHIAMKSKLPSGTATINPDGSLKDPFANLGGTTGGGFNPNANPSSPKEEK